VIKSRTIKWHAELKGYQRPRFRRQRPDPEDGRATCLWTLWLQ